LQRAGNRRVLPRSDPQVFALLETAYRVRCGDAGGVDLISKRLARVE
jgi:hypothetical protein